MTTNPPTSGLDLKLARTRERIKARQIATAMGVSQSRVSTIEREAVVSDEIVRRYFEAIRTCSTDRTSTPTPEAA